MRSSTTHRKLFRPEVSTTSATPSPGMMAANCTGVPRAKCTERSTPDAGVLRDSSKPPSDLRQEGRRRGVGCSAS